MKTVEIEFLNIEKNNKFIKLIQKVINQCLKEEKLKGSMYVNIILTDNSTIKEFNKKYRNINKKTDVLSFPIFEKDELKNMKEKQIEYVLGDIIISIPKIEEQSKEYGHSFEKEFMFMIVHGFYHLMGYDHMTKEEKKQMREKEENILKKGDRK